MSSSRTKRTTSPNPKNTETTEKSKDSTNNSRTKNNPDIEPVPKEDYDKDLSPESNQWKQITKKWVQNYEKIDRNKYSQKLVNKLENKDEPVIILPPLDSSNVESIRVGPGTGKYAKRMFKTNKFFSKGDPICELKGHIMLLYDETKLSDYVMIRPYQYVFFLQTGIGSICIDARYKSNEARYMRKCCQPNAEIQNCMSGKNMHFFVVASRDINEDEEITIQYDFKWKEATYDVECSCDAKARRTCEVVKFNKDRKKKAVEKEQERKQAEKEQRAEKDAENVKNDEKVNKPRVKSLTEAENDPKNVNSPSGRKGRNLIKTDDVKNDRKTEKEKNDKKGAETKDPEFKPKPAAKPAAGRGRKSRGRKKQKEEEEKIDFESFGLHKQFDEFKELVENWRKENPLNLTEIPKGNEEDSEVIKPYKIEPYELKIKKEENQEIPKNFDFDKFFRPHNDLVTSAPYKLPELVYIKSKEVKAHRKLPKKCWRERLAKEYYDKDKGEIVWPENDIQTTIQVMNFEEYEKRNNPEYKAEIKYDDKHKNISPTLQKSFSEQPKSENSIKLESNSSKKEVKKQKISLQDYLKKHKT